MDHSEHFTAYWIAAGRGSAEVEMLLEKAIQDLQHVAGDPPQKNELRTCLAKNLRLRIDRILGPLSALHASVRVPEVSKVSFRCILGNIAQRHQIMGALQAIYTASYVHGKDSPALNRLDDLTTLFKECVFGDIKK